MPRKTSSLVETHPLIAARWVGNVNPQDTRTPDEFSIKARLDCWWWCGNPEHPRVAGPPRDQEYGFSACPTCHQERVDAEERMLASPVGQVPRLIAAWADSRPYDGLSVQAVLDACWGSWEYELRCPAGHKVNKVVRRFLFDGCPHCRGIGTRQVNLAKSIAVEDPELAATFHPTRNAPLTAASTAPTYGKPLYWRSVQCCGHEWQETIAERVLGRRPQAGRGHFYCPACQSVWGSLAWLDPELVAEWHPGNALSPWHVKPYSYDKVVRWRCSTNPDHVWEAEVAARSAGTGCPLCTMAGTSRIEQAFAQAARHHDPDAAPATLGRWRVDIYMPARGLVVEYDGEYWHGAENKAEVDARKTADLLAVGYRVARVRENNLPHLPLQDPKLLQLTYWPVTGDPAAALERVLAWAESS